MPKISVVVPVYKVEKYLNRCVDSIINQTYSDFELILIDDGSPDNAPEMCDEYAAKYDFVHVIHQENGGLSAARNSGIEWALKNSDSEWITFIDSDDWIHPQYLESLLMANLDNHTKISAGQVFVTKEYIVKLDDLPIEHFCEVKTEEFYIDESMDPNSCCCRLFSKDLFKEIRFPVGKLHEDRFTTYKIYFKFPTISVVSFPLYYYFMNDESIIHEKWNPRKLDNIEAAENQMQFFTDHDNTEMLDYILRDYIHLLVYNLRCIKNKSEFKEYEVLLRNKLKKTLAENEEFLHLSFSNDFNTYKYAYPLKSKIYNRLKIRR